MKQLTSNAQDIAHADDLDYRDVIEDLRGPAPELPWRKFVQLIGTERSIAYWQQFQAGKFDHLPVAERNNLRRASGEPELAQPVADIIAQYVDPNATIWQSGDTAGTGVIIFDQDEYPFPSLSSQAPGCNQVTRPVARRSLEDYPDLWAAPTKLLALAISERVEYEPVAE